MEINEKDIDDSLQLQDSDSNMVTASEGYTSSCSPTSANSNPPSEAVSSNCLSLESITLQELTQGHESSQDEYVGSSEERDSFGKRGDADGCSLSNSDETNAKGVGEAEEAEVDSILEAQLEDLTLGQETEPDFKNDVGAKSDCQCKRSEASTFEDNGLALQGAWNELRSSIRQLYRRVVPSQNKNSGNHARSRPSVNRIRALSNMLFNHDPHQLFTRACQLSQEFCIELKVRLLATIHDSPDLDEASSFIQALCESYQWVMSACDSVQGAFEKLDAEHLSMFGLNWMTVNMHTFYASVYTDLDVQDYLNTCTLKARESTLGEEAIGCLASLKRTLGVSESIWSRAESHLQDYAMERAALNAQRRQILADWGGHSKAHNSLGKYFLQKHLNGASANVAGINHLTHKDCTESRESSLSSYGERGSQQCPCSECQIDPNPSHKEFSPSLFNKEFAGKRSDSPGGCECHFCNSSQPQSQTSSMLSTSAGGVLPPLTQPQLSLYPHIHGTTVAVSDIVPPSPSLEELGPIPASASNTKPPMFTNPYLGSDLLTEQLIREWESSYGDALNLPTSASGTSISNGSSDSHSCLVNSLENLCVSSRPQYTNHMIDHSLPFLPDAAPVAPAQTSIVSSYEATIQSPMPATSTNVTVRPPIPMPSPSCCHSGGTSVSSSAPASRPSMTSSLGEPRGSSSSPHDRRPGCKSSVQSLPPQSGESVITHTKSYQAPAVFHKGPPYGDQGDAARSEDNSTSRETPSESETSGHDEWSSGDESDSSNTSSSNHEDSHCDCCYCHMLQSKPGGGRQKYSDRRERLLKILSRKKKANTSSSSSSNTSTTNNHPCGAPNIKPHPGGENSSAGQQTLDEILNFIEGRRCNETTRAKKAAKKARQKEKKLAALRKKQHAPPAKEEKDKKARPAEEEEYDEEDDLEEEEEEDNLELKPEEEEEEDGPLAELRRRAPDVTITVVKPGQRQPIQPSRAPQMSITRDPSSGLPSEASKHPLAAKPLSTPTTLKKEPWSHPNSKPLLPSGNMATMGGFQGALNRSPMGEAAGKFSPSAPPPSGLSNLLKDMESSSKDKEQDAEGKSSQMVTIRRVMDPVSSEPTVTITLKGEEPNKDKVLFKLVNGQGTPTGGKEPPKQKVKQKPPPQVKPVYNIPPGTSPEEEKRMKKQQKKERQRQRKEQEKLEQEKQEQMQQLQLKKQQEYLRQQEKHIKQQQAALQRQQEELLRKKNQTQNSQGKKKGKKGKKVNENAKDTSKKIPMMNFEGDDVARNFNLPPGVSISKVAGQPGMVTISNNMSNNYAQPFLPNPSLYRNSLMPGFPGSSPGYPANNSNVGYSGMYGGCSSNMPWNAPIDPCTGSPEESVIVVDTKAGAMCNPTGGKVKANAQVPGSTKGKSTNKTVKKMISKKAFEKLTSEEKIEAAVRGEADTSWLNQTQKKKYKKALKSIREEKERAIAKQKEEDDLMDQMYQISKGETLRQETSNAGNKSSKSNKGKESSSNSLDLKGNQKKKQSQPVETTRSTKNKPKETLPQQTASSSKNDKKTNTRGNNKSQTQQTLVSNKQTSTQKQAQPKQQAHQHSKAPLPQQSNQAQSKSTSQRNAQKQQQSNALPHSGQKQNGQQKQPQPAPQKSLAQKQTSQQRQQPNQKAPQQKQTSQSQVTTQHQHKQSQSKSQSGQPKGSNTQPKQQNTQAKPLVVQQKQVPTQRQQAQQKHQNPQKHSAQSRQQVSSQSNSNQHTFTPNNSQHSTKSTQGRQNSMHQPNPSKQLSKQHHAAGPPLQQHANFRNIGAYPDKASAANYSQTLGYSNGLGHEARYAQYLAANASTLAAVESSYKSSYPHHDEERYDPPSNKKSRKKGKKGMLEDLNTIDSVFTPKDVAGGELDETEREVEAFKRFCLYNVPRNTGEKPKVNFNVKDILFKNRHGGI